jgi:hypothetical protein
VHNSALKSTCFGVSAGAIILTGGAGNRIAAAAGADASENPPIAEVGGTALVQAKACAAEWNRKAA